MVSLTVGEQIGDSRQLVKVGSYIKRDSARRFRRGIRQQLREGQEEELPRKYYYRGWVA